ncbi:HU family DNA-binding protein [Hippea sp. KM1]|uniref:HU family DNA-binding protein n=1 Tax=Hippea sp. KM1 TaxID=944481 RepID=UPI00046D0B1E|nr:HU family DNA-binding protein [Hippea sp. KM1]
MTKAELIEKVAEKTGATKSQTKKIIDAALETIMEAVAAGEKVGFAGFGTFYVSKRSARMGRNPRTGEKLQIEAFNLPSFKCGRIFKEKVNK